MRLILILVAVLVGAGVYLEKFASEEQHAMVNDVVPVSEYIGKASGFVRGLIGGEEASEETDAEEADSAEETVEDAMTEEEAAEQAALRASLPEMYAGFGVDCPVHDVRGGGLSMLYLACGESMLFYNPGLPGFVEGDPATLEGNPVVTLFSREAGATMESLLPEIQMLSQPVPDRPVVDGCTLALVDEAPFNSRARYELTPPADVLAEWEVLKAESQYPENEYPCGAYGLAADEGGKTTFELIGEDRYAMVHWGGDIQYYAPDTLSLVGE